MATREPGIDEKCMALAAHFLEGNTKADAIDANDLAISIQDAIEDFFDKHPELSS